MTRFAGKVVLISGGARGMGAAEARQIVAEGGRVVIGDVLTEQGTALARELGDTCVFVRLDVGEPGDWAAAVAAARGRKGAETMQQQFSREAVAQIVADRLESIAAMVRDRRGKAGGTAV